VEGGALPRVPYGNADSNKRPTYRFNEADVLNFRRARTAANTAAANGSANGTSTTAATTILGDDCVTLADAANVLGWKRQRVYDQIKAGNLTGRIVGRHMMLPRTELERAKALPKAGLGRPRNMVGRGFDFSGQPVFENPRTLSGGGGGGAGASISGGVTVPAGATALYPPPPPVTTPSTIMSQGFSNVHARLDGIERKVEALKAAIDMLVKAWC
jgi:hypothetical protein